MNAPAFDTGTLSWVRDEIDLALERTGEALARHAAQPDAAGPLAEARSHLHQAGGALTIVGLAGVTHFTETVEARLAELAENPDGNIVAVDAAAGAALSALRRYLDDLMAGHPDQPLRLFPNYRALALAAGQAEPAPTALFFPDLTLRPPRREETQLLPTSRLKALRLGFARGLSKLRNGEMRGLAEMRNAATILEQGLESPAERVLWWVTLAWFDTLSSEAVPAMDMALLAALDQQFEQLANGNAGIAPPTELLRSQLYAIALASPGSEHLECVRAAYRLADLMPSATADIETRRTACRAPLQTAMAEWERFSQGTAIALVRFHDVSQLLAASAQESGDDELARLTSAIDAFAAWLRQQPERAEPALLIEVAGALVLAEDAIEQEGARNPADESLFAAEVAAVLARLDAIQAGVADGRAPLAHQRWREYRIVAQVAREIRFNLDAIEAGFESGSAALHRQIHQVAGAFLMLDEPAAAALANSLDAALTQSSAGTNMALAADWLTTLSHFADSLIRSQPDRELLAVQAAPAAASLPAAPPPAIAVASNDDDDMLAIFIEEAREVLATLAATRPALSANPADREALITIRRGFHTLKGSGRMVGLTELGEAAFDVEKHLNRRLDERTPVDADLLAVIDAATLRFGEWVEKLAAVTAAAAVPPSPTFAEKAPQPQTIENITIGETSLSATLYRLYMDEARGHVAVLQKELSGPAGVPSHDQVRAAHTLAGISAGTGFPSVQTLAHALESALVRHSLARQAPDESDRMLLARTVGALEGMVGAIAERRPPPAENGLTAALDALQPPVPTVTDKPTEISPLAERRQSRPADEIDPQLAELFLEEAAEQLQQLDTELRAWRTTPNQADIGRRMARLLHTFKGGARMCGAMGIGELAHSMETRIEQALAAGGADDVVLDSLDTSLDRANHLVGDLRQPTMPIIPPTPSITTATREPPPIPALAAGESGPAVLLRVRADLVDQLVNQAGEMSITRSRIEGSVRSFKGSLLDLTENVARLRGQLREFEIVAETSMQSQQGSTESSRFDPLEFDRFTRLQELTRIMAESVNDVATVQHALLRQADAAGEAVAIQSRQNRELSHALLRTRMVPFSTVVERLHRIVRQTAKELGKQANLDIRGGDSPVDRSVLERMIAPLEHLLRNAVAHGIEPPEQRRKAGKPELGQIALTITPGDNDIRLTLADDGAGLDLAAIRRRAIERGLLEGDAVIDAAASAELIFLPGFSTADTVSEIAGRGVGLDVVRDEVVQLGGRVEVSATVGQGTRFEIVLPLTLAVIPIMLVRSSDRQWAIPSAMVEEVRELPAGEAAALRSAGSITRGSRQYAWHTLPQLFGEPTGTAPEHAWQLLIKSGSGQLALEVEAITQNQEVVVKPLGAQLARVPGLTGATLLPDGSVALIVNPVALALRGLPPAESPSSVAVPASGHFILPAPTFAKATVMVVDDSLTVRKITGRLLERAGYRVMTAKDGVDALEQLAHALPDVMLADIEMPRMDGFELVRTMRADTRLASLPVVMITSRTADKHRQVAQEIGVQDYLGKPYDEDALLELITSLLRK